MEAEFRVWSGVCHTLSVFGRLLMRREVQGHVGCEVTRVSLAQRSLCESERRRVQAARKHTLVWTPRQSPPADWHLPLPQEEKDK